MILPVRQNFGKRIVIFLLLIIHGMLHSQTNKFGHISVDDGLSNSYVNCLLQDRTGFIWFGTDDGLNRFDGYEMKIYRNNPADSTSISNNIIWALFEDNEGYLWIGTKGSTLDRYDPYTDKFEHWYLDSTGTKDINITFVTQDNKSNLWIGTYRNGLYILDRSQNNFKQWVNTSEDQQILSANFVISILEDENSDIWVSTYYGLNKFDPQSEQKPFIQIDNKLFNEPLWYLANSEFYRNSIWIGKLNGLINFNPQTEDIFQIDLPKNPELQYGNSVSSVVEETYDEEKILWVGTYGGLVRINLTTGQNERFYQNKNNPSGILSNQINDLIIDKSGVVWIATVGGVNFYSPKRTKFNSPVGQTLSFLEYPEIKNGNVTAITKTDDNTFWIGTEKGLFGLQSNNRKSLLMHNSQFEGLNIWSLLAGNSDNLWIGTYGQGLKELSLKTNQIKSWKVENPDFYASPYYYVKALLQDKKGMLWIGFWGGGLARINPSNGKIDYWRYQPNIPGSLSYNDIWDIHQDQKGRIWIGTNGGGLNLFDEITNSFISWKSNSSSESALSSNSIYTIYEISGWDRSQSNETVLWIGTSAGINKFTIYDDSETLKNSNLKIKNTFYTVDDGLSNNSIESILEDENGNLWLGTGSGISFFDIAKETFINYSSADGLARGASNSIASYKTEDGIMLFGSTSGVNVFDPARVPQSEYSPPVVITNFQLFNLPEDANDNSALPQSITYTTNLKLTYDQNDFSLQFAALDYNTPNAIKYAYKLEGFDKDWIYSGTRRFVTYTNLDAGEYVFRVKSTNSDGVWSDNDNKLPITISPPFWMTWWAYSVYGIIFFGSLYLIRDTEIKRRKKKEEERLRRERESAQLREAKLKAITIEQEKEIEKQKIRNRIAQDLHDEIGSNLSSISLMSELVQKDGKINTEALEKINRIQKVARVSSQSMRDIVWLTNPSSDSIKDLISKMNEVANDMLGDLKWKFYFPKNVSEMRLVPEVKRNFFFIYKESLNNILKHAHAKNVEIDFKILDTKILLKIKDDGNGFDSTLMYRGNGLKNLQSRAKEINGELTIDSLLNNGTTIDLTVNITQVRD